MGRIRVSDVKYLTVLLLLVLLPTPVREDWTPDTVGDAEFVARINDATRIVERAGWLGYLHTNVGQVVETAGGPAGFVQASRVQWDGTRWIYRGIVSLRYNAGDVQWTAIALIHEAAHIAEVNANLNPCDARGEITADFVTAAFAESAGMAYRIRHDNEIDTGGMCYVW